MVFWYRRVFSKIKMHKEKLLYLTQTISRAVNNMMHRNFQKFLDELSFFLIRDWELYRYEKYHVFYGGEKEDRKANYTDMVRHVLFLSFLQDYSINLTIHFLVSCIPSVMHFCPFWSFMFCAIFASCVEIFLQLHFSYVICRIDSFASHLQNYFLTCDLSFQFVCWSCCVFAV